MSVELRSAVTQKERKPRVPVIKQVVVLDEMKIKTLRNLSGKSFTEVLNKLFSK